MPAAGAAPAAVVLRSAAVAGQPHADGSQKSPAEVGAPFDGAGRLDASKTDDVPAVNAAAPEERRSSGLSPPTAEDVSSAYLSDHPRSLVPDIIEKRVAWNVADFAAQVLASWTFVGEHAMDMMFGPTSTRDQLSLAAAAAGQEIIDWAGQPQSRRFMEMLGRWLARSENAQSGAPRQLPKDIVGTGEYWDMASGLNAGPIIGGELEPGMRYSFFDISPFVTSYLRETADLVGARNARIMEGDILNIRKPEKPLAVLRTKNAVMYIQDFEKKLQEMSEWIAPGGSLIVQNNPMGPQRRAIIAGHGALLLRLLEQGWDFKFSFSDAKGAEHALDTLIFTRPQDIRARRSASEAKALWDSYLVATGGRGS